MMEGRWVLTLLSVMEVAAVEEEEEEEEWYPYLLAVVLAGEGF
jgi:hypothetical protein